MSELARRRNARDIWISRSHLYATGAAVALAVLAAFGVGYGVGRSSVDLPVSAPQRVSAEAGDDALLELLARVDAAASPDGGVRELTFPDALTAEEAVAEVPEARGAEDRASSVLPGSTPASPEVLDTPPRGRFTVVVGSFDSVATARGRADALRAAEEIAWVGVEQLEGARRYRVAVGGWHTESEAAEALEPLQARFPDAVVAPY